jgi:hypothetical protein
MNRTRRRLSRRRRFTAPTRGALVCPILSVSPVEVLHLTCAQAKHTIQRAKILLTPGGPIFSTHGYTCSSRNILPRVDPSPIQLPAAEHCTGAQHRQVSFIWDYAAEALKPAG